MAEGQWEEAAHHLEESRTQAGHVGDLQAQRGAARSLAELEVRQGRSQAACARLVPLLDRPGLEEFDVTHFLPVLAWYKNPLGLLTPLISHIFPLLVVTGLMRWLLGTKDVWKGRRI